ncbi:MAG: antitoxin component YwqK of YwqJK toxin-antitoxin module [Patiriisocius sp.]|jgi:antitoxin component YwqK of YwqJK toxin-antitoxin module
MIRSIYLLGLIFCLSACAQKGSDVVKAEDASSNKGSINNTNTSENLEQESVPYVEKYPSGGIKMEGQKVNDLKVGSWVSYYENGVKWSEGEYINGTKNGKFKDYFQNGLLRYKGAYVNDLKQGPWLFYDEEGKIIKRVSYHRGEMSED